MKSNFIKAGLAAVLATALSIMPSQAGQDDALIDALVQKGVISAKEAAQIRDKAMTDLNTAPTQVISFNKAIKSLSLYGDIRLRAEIRDGKYAINSLNANTGTLYPSAGSDGRDRLRYRFRFGLNGELNDNVFFGLGVASGYTNDKSGNVTFGDQGSAGPFGKAKGVIAINRIFLGWKPTDYLTVEAGQVDNPFYCTNLTWDPNINPTGFFEQFQKDVGPVNIFGNFGQMIYGATSFDDSSALGGRNLTDIWMLEEQIGIKWKISKDMNFKGAVGVTNYTGTRTTTTNNGASQTQTAAFSAAPLVLNGQNQQPTDFAGPFVGAYPDTYTNDYGVNNLFILDVPAEFNFKAWNIPMKVFGDFAWNLSADGRSHQTAAVIGSGTELSAPGTAGTTYPGAAPGAIPAADYKSPYILNLKRGNGGQDMAFEAGFQAGELKKKGDWLAKAYWLDREYYSLDPNLVDSDIFDGRTNLEGYVIQGNYNLTDDLTFTLQYGEAGRADKDLSTPGIEQDLNVGTIAHYRIVQGDLMWKF